MAPSNETAALRLRIRNVAGRVVDLEVDPSSRVRDVKLKLSEHFQVPAMCQRLLVGSNAVQDGEVLADSCEEPGEPLSMMLVVALDEARKQLADGSKRIRQEAVQAFAQVAPKGNRGAISAVSELLQDSEPEVRAAAVQSLAEVATQGDERAISSISDRVKDQQPEVRWTALHALARIVPQGGSQGAMAAAGRGVSDSNKSVRLAALEVLPRVSSGPEVVDVLGVALAHKQQEVRLTALKALTLLNLEGDERAISAAGALLEDQDPHVKQEALLTMTKLVPSKDKRAVVQAVARLKHGRTHARTAAMNSLARTSPKSKGLAVDALSAALEEPEKGLKVEALKALAHVAEAGDEKATASVLRCLEDPRPEVRFAALKTLPALVLAGGKDLQVLARVAALCESKDKGVKRDAQQVLYQLAPTDDHRAVAVALGQLNHGHASAKPAALETLASEAAGQNYHAVAAVLALLKEVSPVVALPELLGALSRAPLLRSTPMAAAVCPYLRHESAQVKLLALRVIGLTACQANTPCLEAVASLFEDAQDEIRQPAFDVLVGLASRGCRRIVAAVGQLLGNKRAEVRRLALRALAHVAAVDDERTVAAVKVLAEDWDERVRHEALKTLAVLSPKGRENLAMVASSAQRAVVAGSANLRPGMRPMRKAVSLTALNMLGQTAAEKAPVGKARGSTVRFEDQLGRIADPELYRNGLLQLP